MKPGALAIKSRIPIFLKALFKKETPWYVKGLMTTTLLYAFMPLDILPDFMAFVGLLDDALVIPLLASIAMSLMPEKVMQETYEANQRKQHPIKEAEKVED